MFTNNQESLLNLVYFKKKNVLLGYFVLVEERGVSGVIHDQVLDDATSHSVVRHHQLGLVHLPKGAQYVAELV